MKKYGFVWLVAVSVCVLSGCSSHALDEAQRTVAQADSLRAEGGMYTDSTSLAQAYTTLYAWRACHADDYAHACYYYGRLLRDRDNPVAAMQCLINATHSRTRDNHILGRVYSNMGEIAHLASDYSLSYDMFERSADMFLQVKDSLTFNYCLYRMAFAKAMVADKENTLSILRLINNPSQIDLLSTCVSMTYAEMYLQCKQCDSAIYYANRAIHNGNSDPICLLIKAQAYSLLRQKDSAVIFANHVMETTESPYDINNALYILTNDDETKDNATLRQQASQRADIQLMLKIRQGKLSQATQLLEQDRNHKPNYLHIVGIAILAIGLCMSLIAISHKKKKLSQQQTEYMNKRQEELEMNCIALRNCKNLRKELDWDNYDSMCTIVNARLYGIAQKLSSQPNITNNDVRICVLFLIDLPYSNIAEILNLSPKSIAKLKSITAHKLNVTMRNLRIILIDMACQIDSPHTPEKHFS